jgi:hypothetical protein
MSDEFDDALDGEVMRRSATLPGKADPLARPRVGRLVARLYGEASAPLRARMLACLIRPLSPLGLVAVASGAFGSLLHRWGDRGPGIPLDEVGRFSNDQILDLVRFVEQVGPEAVQQVASLITENPVGVAAFSASAAMLLLRIVRARGQTGDGSGEA